jgi:hypothetical protein
MGFPQFFLRNFIGSLQVFTLFNNFLGLTAIKAHLLYEYGALKLKFRPTYAFS